MTEEAHGYSSVPISVRGLESMGVQNRQNPIVLGVQIVWGDNLSTKNPTYDCLIAVIFK